MQILLLQDRLDLREKISFFIESTYSGRVLEASSVAEGVKHVKDAKGPIDLVILDTKEGTPEEITEFWSVCAQIPTLLCVQSTPQGSTIPPNVVGIIERSSFMEGVVSTIDGLMSKGTIQDKPSESGGQVRIRTKLLLSVCPLKGDIYIKINENKYIKLFHEGDVFDLVDLEKYTVRKGVEYLYIRKEQCTEFATKYKDELQKLLQSENLNVEDVSRLSVSVHETAQELTKEIGFTREVQELARTQVQLTIKAMGKDPDLSELLAKLKSTEGKYISSHSTLCSYLACAIAAQIQWGSETTFYKLSLASFLHDISLDNHELAELGTIEELDKAGAKFTAKEQKDFREHPMVTAEMAKKMTEVPPDVDTIIRQHHERPDGTGFPRKITHTYIAPLASVFIVAHDLTQYVSKAGEHFDAQVFLDQVKDKYKSSQFKKILGCIENITKIKKLSSAIRAKSQ